MITPIPYPQNASVGYRDRADRPEEDWKDRGFMGPTQWDRLTEAFSTDFAECETVLLITPTPLILVSPG